MSRCEIGGMIILPAKITSTQFEYMIHNCQQDCFSGIVPTSTRLSSVGSTGWDITRYLSEQAKKIVMSGTFSNTWNWKNQWWERIPNWRKLVPNWREHILRSEKLNSDENSRVQKVRNRNNCGIQWNSKRISQPRFYKGYCTPAHPCSMGVW